MTTSFGVVTPTLNAERYFVSCLDSIWAQQGEGVEVDHVVVDGGSLDRTAEIARRYPSRVIVASDGGMYEALNRGMQLVRGDVVGYVNADDEIAPGALCAVGEALTRHPKAQWVCGGVDLIDGEGTALGSMRMVRVSRIGLVGLGWCPIHSMTVWVRRAFFERVGGFDPSFRQAGDYDWYARAMAIEPPLVIDQTLASFRLHGQNLSKDLSGMAAESARVQDRYGGRSLRAKAAGKLLSLRLNLRNPTWFLAKKRGRLHQGKLPRVASRARGR